MLQWASLVAQLVKNPPAMQEMQVQFLDWEDLVEKDRLLTPVFLGFLCGLSCNGGDLGWEDPLENGKATHFSVLDWKIPWGHKESDMTEQLHFASVVVGSN